MIISRIAKECLRSKPTFLPITKLSTTASCLEDTDSGIGGRSYFDLKSIYLGCAVTTEAAVGLPQSCTVQFNGTTASGKWFAEKCSYAGTVFDPALILCKFSTLKSVRAIDISVPGSATLPNTTVVIIDNPVGTLYSSS